MGACTLPHIPAHLHFDAKDPLPEFFVLEEIYRRGRTKHLLENPFGSISLYDVSVNRQGQPGQTPLSQPDDVFLKAELETPSDPEIKYPDEVLVTMIIMEVAGNPPTYRKPLKETHDDGIVHIATITLLHDPLDCMYPHCVFEIQLDGQVVTKDNYDTGLNLKGARLPYLKRLRNSCRHELAEMIITKKIRINTSGTE